MPDAPAAAPPQAAVRCGNCGTGLVGPHCHACGMRHASRRLRLHDLVAEAWRDVFGLDGRLWRTFRELTMRPGDAVRAWVNGRRDLLVAPVRYYFGAVVAYVVVMSAVGMPSYDRAASMAGVNPEAGILMSAYLEFLESHLKVLSVALFPLIALLFHSAFRSQGYDLAETFAFTLFTYGQCILLSTPVIALLTLADDAVTEQVLLPAVAAAYVPYLTWAARRFFGDTLAWTFVKVLVVFAAHVVLTHLLLLGALLAAAALA